ncbi:MAG: NTP transferase domain-containing protein [Nitriliruptorales bacterium]|nr:NTP transferase domain-containing protein [Nitriliruptorales bacterium]
MNGPGRDAGVPGGLLLAAGEGRRFGGPKALVELDGQTLLERGVGVLRAARLHPVVVVLGAAAEEVRSTADLDGCMVVVNREWTNGMGSSLRLGLARLTPAATGAVVTLVDQPLVTAAAIERLTVAWRNGAVAAVATYGGQPANPVLLDASIWIDVAAQAVGDVGARQFLRGHPELVTAVVCDDAGAPDDIDTPEDLVAVRSQLRR